MPSKRTFLLAACWAGLASAQVVSETVAPKPQLTARELFYLAAQNPSAAQTTSKVAPANKSQGKAAATAPTKPASPEVAAAPAKSTPLPLARSEQAQADLADGARIVPVSTSATPLGLKYSILKKSGDDMVEVPASSVFHAGDRIQISVQTNVSGYLYIINRGSSGIWKPMFPSAEVEDGNNRIEGFRNYVFPPKSRILFDEQTGNEKLFLVFSREPEPNLEKMIYSLQGNEPLTAPKKEEAAKTKTLLVLANPRIDDAAVGILRTAYARDLLIEKVDEKTVKTTGEKKENAVYVVNPNGGSDSRVVADVRLEHQ